MRIYELWGVYHECKLIAYFDNKEEAAAFANEQYFPCYVHKDIFNG